MKQRIAIDMDEVIADALSGYLERYKEEFQIELVQADLLGKKVYDVVQEDHRAVVRAYPITETFFRNLRAIEGSQEVIRELNQRYEVFIATAAMEFPTSFVAKFEWLQEHFDFISPMNIVFCGDKSILATDYLIDDHTRHFTNFRGEGILFTAPHNASETGYRRVNSWQDVHALFLT